MKRNLLVALATLTVCAFATSAQAQRNGSGSGTPPQLDPAAREALLEALTGPFGEYAARAEYKAITAAYGAAVLPYARLLAAEEQHISILKQQCATYGVPVPADPYAAGVTPPPTLLEAAQTGIVEETANAAMYATLLTKVQRYPGLARAFTNLRNASLNSHLPALQAALANGGTSPTPGTCTGTCPGTGTGTCPGTGTGTCPGTGTGTCPGTPGTPAGTQIQDQDRIRLQDGTCPD
jgi:multidrug efflux pump subunit AcrA (membrane-fusion protein)